MDTAIPYYEQAPYSKIITDETLMEERPHGNAEYPFQFYYETMSMFDFNRIDWHWHTELEFVYVTDGSICVWVNEDLIELSAGNGLFINSKVMHQFHSTDDATIPNLLFLPTHLAPAGSRIYQKYVYPVITSALTYQSFTEDVPWQAKILENLKEITRLHLIGTANELQISILLQQLWLELVSNTEFAQMSKDQKPSHARLQLMMEYIHSHYAQNLQLEDIAAAAHISKSTALNLFRSVLQTTPVNYLISYRLKQAALRLSTTERKIGTISTETGFENVDHFCRTFKKHYNMTPTEYRKEKL